MNTNPNEEGSAENVELESALQNLSLLPSSIDPMQTMFDAGVARGKWIASQAVSPRDSVFRSGTGRSRIRLAMVASLLFLATSVVLAVSTWQLRATNRVLASQLDQLERDEVVRNRDQDAKRGLAKELIAQDRVESIARSPEVAGSDPRNELDEWVAVESGLPASKVIWLRGVAIRPSDEFRNPQGVSFETTAGGDESESVIVEQERPTNGSLLRQRLRSYEFQGL